MSELSRFVCILCHVTLHVKSNPEKVNWTTNDPEPQMIPDVDRKWSRRETRNGMEFALPVEVYFININSGHN